MNAADQDPQVIIDVLHQDLLKARKARDLITTEILQSIIAAIDNAGAVPIPDNMNSIGVGSTEIARKDLSVKDIQNLIKNEIAELQQAIDMTNSAANNNISQQLRDKVIILQNYLP